MKTDTIFYSLFQEFPSFFFELIDCSPKEAAAYEFTSRKIKQQAFCIDGLFLPKTNEPEKPFYLVEVQFQPEADLYYRIFGELFLYLRQYKPPHPWRVVVFYPSRHVEVQPRQHFEELLNCSRVQRIYLDELDADAETSLGVKVVKLVIEPEVTAGEQARQLITLARQQLTDAAVQRDLINLLETIIVYKFPQKSCEEIAAMFNLNELKQTRFYQEAKQEGVEEGIEQGKQEGERQAKLAAIPRMMTFGLNAKNIAKLLELNLGFVQRNITQIKRQSMFFSEQNIETFIDLLIQQPSLFSPDKLTELDQLIESLPDDIHSLSEAISDWSEKYPEIEAVQAQLLETLGSTSSEMAPGSKKGNVPKPKLPLNKKTLKNAIQQSSVTNRYKDSQDS